MGEISLSGTTVSCPPRVVIIGAGPAGLTAAYTLAKQKIRSVVLERDDQVGGLARTEEYKGYLFDLGGHRFFTKVSLVEQMWHEVLGADFLIRKRLSRIYYNSKFFHYPLEPLNALQGLGLLESVRCALSYLKSRILPLREEDTFDAWISNRFGRRLFEIFFKTYTEKVWGIPCDQIHSDWAAQRIKGLSFGSLLRSLIRRTPEQNKQNVIKTLIHEFHYPRLGPGMMWQKCKELIEQSGCEVRFNSPVEKIHWEPGRVRQVVAGGIAYAGDHFISTMPIRELIECLDPIPPKEVLQAQEDFRYRDFLLVSLIIRADQLFPDNWIYVHDPSVRVGRIQNFNNWSPDMNPHPGTTCLGLEYFCNEGDDLWKLSDNKLAELGASELACLRLADPALVLDSKIVRVRKAYPVYDGNYRRGLAIVRQFVESLDNLQLVGRNGMHRYNNQDHSMLTAMLAARNILGGRYDLWQVNVDAEYHESGPSLTEEQLQAFDASQPLVPMIKSRTSADGF